MRRCLALAVVGALCCAPRLAGACSCKQRDVSPEGVRRGLDDADVVFSGRVLTSVRGLRWREAGLVPWNEWVHRVVFAVDRVWRGELGRRVTVITSVSDASCGVRLPVGTRHVVFADRTPEGQLDVDSCSLTSSRRDPDIDRLLAGLGDGRPPKLDTRGCAIGRTGAADLLVAIALLAWSRKRRCGSTAVALT